MASLLLTSILVAMLAIPLSVAGDPRPTRGLKRAGALFAAFVTAWAYALLHLFPVLKK